MKWELLHHAIVLLAAGVRLSCDQQEVAKSGAVAAGVRRHGVRRYFRTSACDARLTACRAQSVCQQTATAGWKKLHRKRRVDSAGPFLPSLPPRQPTNNLLSPRNPSRSRELQTPYVRLHNRTCVLFSSFPTRKTPQKKFENSRKKDQISLPIPKKKKKPTKPTKTPFPPFSSNKSRRGTCVFFFDQPQALRPADTESDRFPYHAVRL
jgi:hypothetical protein